MNIIDRRANPKGKSLPNRQRFIDRAREQVKKAVADSIARRKVSDVGAQQKVKVTGKGTAEPSLHHGTGGDRDHVLPGNREYVPGDEIARPRGGGEGRGRNASDSGEGEDSFEFTLSREEFLDLFFEDLALPDLVKQKLKDMATTKPQRAGFSVSGSPTALNVVRTMRNSLARRIALKRPDAEELAVLQEAIDAAVAAGDAEALSAARAALDEALRKSARIPYIDPIDVRYNRFEQVPKPNSNAVMFCLMDVSGSMTEHMKDLAKRFFMLLHLFLERKYEKVSVVFIRHTHEAKEVDEDTFFRSRETGGTIVSTALEVMLAVQKERFPEDEWNIYVAQASDGDNMSSDNPQVVSLMTGKVLPLVQHFAYIETGSSGIDSFLGNRATDLWRTYETMLGDPAVAAKLAMRRVTHAGEIWGVFADLFSKDRKRAA